MASPASGYNPTYTIMVSSYVFFQKNNLRKALIPFIGVKSLIAQIPRRSQQNQTSCASPRISRAGAFSLDTDCRRTI